MDFEGEDAEFQEQLYKLSLEKVRNIASLYADCPILATGTKSELIEWAVLAESGCVSS